MGETVSFLRALDAGNPHVQCDEREQETELCQTGLRRRGESLANRHRETKVTAPVLDSTKTSEFVKIQPDRHDFKGFSAVQGAQIV